MNKKEFYRYYIPALVKALEDDEKRDGFFVKGPEYFMETTDETLLKEIDIYIDQSAGEDDFLDKVAYYFDAKSHGFSEIDGVDIGKYKDRLLELIIEYKINYGLA